jgi:hypothetical protein
MTDAPTTTTLQHAETGTHASEDTNMVSTNEGAELAPCTIF